MQLAAPAFLLVVFPGRMAGVSPCQENGRPGHGRVVTVPNNPQAFRGAAPYYAIGRPPYSPALRDTLARVLGLDGTGRLLDVGCGPGILAVELAPLFSEVVGLDPEPGMLAEGRSRADQAGFGRQIHWVEAVAEDIPELQLEPCRVVTFGQSFHRVDRSPVTEAVYELLEPGGAIALVSHLVQDRPRPSGPDLPAIPHDEVKALIAVYLGAERVPPDPPVPGEERWEKLLERTRFGKPRIAYAPGRADYVRDIDSVVANYYSMSYATPPLFGDAREQYESDLRALLARHSPGGLFWDWPGDTEIVYARKP